MTMQYIAMKAMARPVPVEEMSMDALELLIQTKPFDSTRTREAEEELAYRKEKLSK